MPRRLLRHTRSPIKTPSVSLTPGHLHYLHFRWKLVKAPMEAFMEASVKALIEASTAWKHESVRERFYTSMEASIASMKASMEAFTSFHQKFKQCR